jgi:hypothetical protein
MFDALGMTARSQGLAMPILLVTDSASSCTSSTSWVLGVALEDEERQKMY